MPKPPSPLVPVETAPATAAAPAAPTSPPDRDLEQILTLDPNAPVSRREFRQFALHLLNRPKFRTKILEKWDSLELPIPLVLFLLQHAVGKPPDVLDVRGPRPVIVLPPGSEARARLEQALEAAGVEAEPPPDDAEQEVVLP